MRAKIALLVALASFLALSALGVGMAGADPVAEGAPTEPSVATTTAAVPSLQAPACANGLDDDADGLIDLADPDCTSPTGTSEAAMAPSGATATTPVPAPEVTAPAPSPRKESGVKKGATIDAGEAGGNGVTRNESLGDASGGGGSGGGVKAPSATGGGDQPLADSGDGGSQFGSGGSPTTANPTTTIAPFGPAPIGVPNFVIDSFEIPPFLLPIYQACGTEYGIPWEVLASINKIETGFGTNLNLSSAGAVGWMQFLPSSWEMYGVDANGDGRKDPYNPVDAICAAASYLKAAGGNKDLYGAIFAYNHADWYVQEVLLYARAYGKLPSDLVGSLTGLTEGAHFPVAADARYADDISARAALKSSGDAAASSGAAEVISSSPTRRGINIFAKRGAPVVAVNDGIIRKLGSSPELGKFIVLEDTYGNRYTYAELGGVVRDHRLVVMPTGEEQRLPVESQNLRPRSTGAAGPRHWRRPGGRTRRRCQCRSSRQGRLAASRLEGDRRHRPGPHRGRQRGCRPPSQLLDPPGRQGRTADRPEADPRRLEAAGGDGDLPRQGQEPLHLPPQRRRRPVALQGGAAETGVGRRRPLDLRLRSRRHRHRPDRSPHPGDARVPALEGLQADDHRAQVRPQLSSPPPATSPSTAPATRST